MSTQKELPISMQSFSQIITEDCVYIDKTEYIFKLAKSRKLYFLSRPRRFGKSLLVSTFECLFEGKEELFKGLWIHNKSDWRWKQYPVIILDFNDMPHKSTQELNTVLNLTLEEQAAQNKIELKTPFITTKFRELILKLKEKTGQDVVVLVDEYDKSIIDFIGRGEENLKIAIENRDFMKGFYGILKGSKVASSLRFVFITGVSKFTKISIFSELNNLDDLTMQEKYCAILGYTQEELIYYFKDRINELAEKFNINYDETIAMLNTWYYGFRFSDKEVKVYNPVSILKAFNELSFKNYWFETGSPTFLINLLKKKEFFLPDLEKIEASMDTFSAYNIENLSAEPILFQTGYLTIKNIKEVFGRYIKENMYLLSYPNEEVRTSLSRHLFAAYSKIANGKRSRLLYLLEFLDKSDYDNFFDTIKSLYASIPYTLIAKRDEGYFHSLFYLMMCGSGIHPHNEVLTSKGRIDLLIEFTNKVFVIEFKCDQNANKAIKQIKEKGYTEKYQDKGINILLMGINFSKKERNIKEWKVEKMKIR
ncbi:AAA ATPase-like domain-containing protein, nuclease domain-containing [Candidatus Magnetomoraceae bacterium gMMP-1]